VQAVILELGVLNQQGTNLDVRIKILFMQSMKPSKFSSSYVDGLECLK